MTTRVVLFAILLSSLACSYTPTAPTPFTGPEPQILQGTVYPTGSTPFVLTMTRPGTLSVTLTTVDPSSTVGLAVGVRNEERRTCDVTVAVKTRAGSQPQITAPISAGEYCVEVSDAGSVTSSGTTFSISVQLQ